jgi:cobalt/nickel transport system permease protein
MAKAAIVLPFTVTFASVSWLAGDPGRAVSLVVKSYLSALAVLVVVASTPLPALLTGMESLGAPRFLVLVVQFLYRYLFVIAGQAAGMRVASVSRASQSAGGRRRGFRAASGALSVLFARSCARAEGVHRAMLARAFDRHFPLLSPSRWRASDGFFLAAAIMAAAGLRYASGR